MKLLVLSTEEALLLSSICPKKVMVKSPMKRIYLLSQFAFRQKAFTHSVPKFLDEDVLLIDKDEKLHLTQELIPVFWTLNAPQEYFTLSRKSSADILEVAWCRNGNLWVQQATSIDQEVEFITYPFEEEALNNWFRNDFIADLQFGQDQANAFPDICRELSIRAVSFLLAIQMVYRKRFDQNQELKEEDLPVGLDDISDLMTSGNFDPAGELAMGSQVVELLNSGRDKLQPAIDELLKGGFIERHAEKYLFSSLSKSLFDPGRIQDMILYKYLDEKLIIKTVTVLEGGYMILEHPTTEEADRVFIRAIPGDQDKTELLFALRNELFGRSLDPEPIDKSVNEVSSREFFYIDTYNQQKGPFTIDEMKDQAIGARTLVWFNGADGWIVASEVPELTAFLPPTPPPDEISDDERPPPPPPDVK